MDRRHVVTASNRLTVDARRAVAELPGRRDRIVPNLGPTPVGFGGWPHWTRKAACRDAYPRWFDLDDELDQAFPRDYYLPDPALVQSARNARHAKAIAVCASCPVATTCLTDALAANAEGVYGGYPLQNERTDP